MAAAIENAANVKPSTLRVRRHRERRREGLCSFTIEMSKADIDETIFAQDIEDGALCDEPPLASGRNNF